jgi:hypothetical protein
MRMNFDESARYDVVLDAIQGAGNIRSTLRVTSVSGRARAQPSIDVVLRKADMEHTADRR